MKTRQAVYEICAAATVSAVSPFEIEDGLWPSLELLQRIIAQANSVELEVSSRAVWFKFWSKGRFVSFRKVRPTNDGWLRGFIAIETHSGAALNVASALEQWGFQNEAPRSLVGHIL
jgi:hypothetical protein